MSCITVTRLHSSQAHNRVTAVNGPVLLLQRHTDLNQVHPQSLSSPLYLSTTLVLETPCMRIEEKRWRSRSHKRVSQIAHHGIVLQRRGSCPYPLRPSFKQSTRVIYTDEALTELPPFWGCLCHSRRVHLFRSPVVPVTASKLGVEPRLCASNRSNAASFAFAARDEHHRGVLRRPIVQQGVARWHC